jgi:peptide/nickel transport system permease protein
VEGMPGYLLLVCLAALSHAAGVGASGLVLILAALFWPSTARAIRLQTSLIRPEPYMDAAIVLGYAPMRRALGQLLPLLKPMLGASACLILASCMRAQLLLGFVGLDALAKPSIGTLLNRGALDALSFHFTSLLIALGLSMLILLALESLARRSSNWTR